MYHQLNVNMARLCVLGMMLGTVLLDARALTARFAGNIECA